MTKEELKSKLFEAYKAVDDYTNECNKVWNKYSKMKEEELPYKIYLNNLRELNATVRDYENKLKDIQRAESKDKGKRERIKSPYLEYLLDDINNHPEAFIKERPEEMPTKDNAPNTDEKAKSLQERLVQCCIDYILETGDNDIDTVSFHADSLQESANFGKWTPSTDSHIGIKTRVWDDEIKQPILVDTGEYF